MFTPRKKAPQSSSELLKDLRKDYMKFEGHQTILKKSTNDKSLSH